MTSVTSVTRFSKMVSAMSVNSVEKNKSADVPPTPAAASSPATPSPPPTTFAPCPTCNGSHFWFDRFGAWPRCSTCHPWPSRSLVAYRTIGGRRVPERGESPVDATADATADATDAFPGRSDAELDREFARNWTTTKHGPCEIWPNGYTAHERKGVFEQMHRFAIEALRQQERNQIRAKITTKATALDDL